MRRYHPNGELSLESPYHRARPHGKQIMTRPSEGSSPENTVMIPLDGVFRMDTLNVDGSPQGIATFYNRAGLFDPVPADADGRSIDLGAHLGKLLQTTALVAVTPFLHTMTGKIIELRVLAGLYRAISHVVNATGVAREPSAPRFAGRLDPGTRQDDAK